MKKRLLMTLFVFLFSALLAFGFSNKASALTSSNAYHGAYMVKQGPVWIHFTVTGDEAEIVCYVTADDHSYITIPSKVEGYKVTSILPDALKNDDREFFLTLPSGITELKGLKSEKVTGIKLPSSLRKISGPMELGSISSLTLPASVEEIAPSAFANCYSLDHVEVEEGNAYYYSENDCVIEKSTKKLIVGTNNSIIPSGVEKIEARAFFKRKGLKEAIVPEGVKEIENSAFYMCEALERAVLPSTLEKLGYGAFYYCSSLTYVDLGSGITKIEESCFQGCQKLTEVRGGDKIEVFERNAFARCGMLKIFSLPPSLKTVNEWAFQNCTSLTELVFPEGAEVIGEHSFENCSGLTKVILPQSVDTIGSGAFADCVLLDSIVIPDNVKTISSYTFKSCSGLTSVSFPDGLETVSSVAFGNCKKLTSISFPDGVTSIGAYAFNGCSGLSNVTFGKNLTEIGAHSFDGCSLLTQITFPDHLTKIGDSAFNDCLKLEKAYIPFSVTEIQSLAFGNCNDLTIYGFSGSAAETYSRSFKINFVSVGQNVYFDYTVINGEVKILSLKDKTFSGKIVIPKVIDGKEVTSVGDSAFLNCAGITEISFPYCMREIGDRAFEGCTGISSIVLHNTYHIGKRAFYGCNRLSSIYVSSLYSLGEDALEGTAFYDSCFYGIVKLGNVLYRYKGVCPEILEITENVNVSSITANAFAGQTALSEVILPYGIRTVGEGAFSGCPSLKKVTVKGKETVFEKGVFEGAHEDLTVYGIGNTAVEEYANANGIRFVPFYYLFVNGNTEFRYVKNGDGTSKIIKLNWGMRFSVVIPEKVRDTAIVEIGDDFFNDWIGTLWIPDSVTVISSDRSFYNLNKIVCRRNSYAERFASEHGIPVELYDSIRCGDSNDDGKITSLDLIRTKKYIAAYNSVNGTSKVRVGLGADLNLDGAIDSLDLVRLKRYLAEFDPATGRSSIVLDVV